MLLKIEGLCVSVEGKSIIKDFDFSMKAGEIHAIMGPNGSGKSTLARVLSGDPIYKVEAGSILFQDQDLLEMAPEERAAAGVFLGFQYPIEVPGVTNRGFLHMIYNAKLKHQGDEALDPLEFQQLLSEKMALVGFDDSFLKRSLNQGFSGGEKKRNEILQLALLEPCLAILDEIDSGLDIDAIKVVSSAILTTQNENRGLLLITHYQRLLNFVTPHFVHIMQNGRICESGDASLAKRLEEQGYKDHGYEQEVVRG